MSIFSRSVKWLPLFATNFLSVLNDNFLKNLIIFLSVGWVGEDGHSAVMALAAAFLVLPYLIFSPYAGNLSLKYPKRKIIQLAQLVEIPIILIAGVGFLMESTVVVLLAVFGMGVQSCLYSPSKYGIIREVGGKDEISFGTGAMEMFTFIAILIGTYVAGLVSDLDIGNSDVNEGFWASVWLIAIAVVGWLVSLKVRSNFSFVSDEKLDLESVYPWVFVKKMFLWGKQEGKVNYVVFGLSSFWLVGSLIQLNTVPYSKKVLGIEEDAEIGMIMALVAIAIGVGCFFAGLLSKYINEMKLVVLGGLGMFVCMTLVVVLPVSKPLFIALVMLTAFFGGFFKIPLNAWMQENIEGEKLSEVLAYNNMAVFAFLLVSAGVFAGVEMLAGSVAVFAVVAFLALAMTFFLKFTLMKPSPDDRS